MQNSVTHQSIEVPACSLSPCRMRKLMYRVVFPLELKLSNITSDAQGGDTLYNLFAVVVHVGSGPHHGHYVSLIKTHNNWLFFDDENVESITESQVQSTFGSTQEFGSNNMDHGRTCLQCSASCSYMHIFCSA